MSTAGDVAKGLRDVLRMNARIVMFAGKVERLERDVSWLRESGAKTREELHALRGFIQGAAAVSGKALPGST
ncbi:MAG TPA: hypothetical protein VF292_02490 [Rhodanobacteraceae bacterium]